METKKDTDIFWIVGVVFIIFGLLGKLLKGKEYFGDIFFIIGILSIIVAILLNLAKGDRLKDWLIQDWLRFYVPLFVFFIIVLSFLNYFYSISFKEILTEANGIILDLGIFGILWAVYERAKSRKEKINTLLIEIESYRYIHSEPDKRRFKQIILELNHVGFSAINLNDFDLSGLILEKMNLNGAELIGTDFTNTSVYNSNFENCKIGAGGYENFNVDNSSFRYCYFNNFSGKDVTFVKCDFRNSIFESCFFNNIKFDNCIIESKDWIENLKKSRNRKIMDFVNSHTVKDVNNDMILFKEN